MTALGRAAIIRSVAEELEVQNTQAAELVETVIELVKSTLAAGEDVLITGFGKFSVKSKRARNAHNPVTGDSMVISPRKIVTFYWSGKLRKKLNQEANFGLSHGP
jgi:integration host factor subunit alpha